MPSANAPLAIEFVSWAAMKLRLAGGSQKKRITSSVGYRDVYPTLIGWTATGLLDPSLIVTRKVALDRAVVDGFDALLVDKRQVKILVSPNGVEA